MATPAPDNKYTLDNTLGQDPAPIVSGAELDAHRLISRWRGEPPNCLVAQVEEDVRAVLELASRINKGTNKEALDDTGIYTSCGKKAGTLTPISTVHNIGCCNESQD